MGEDQIMKIMIENFQIETYRFGNQDGEKNS